MSRAIKFRVWDSDGKYFRRANIEGPKNSAWGVKIDRGIFNLSSVESLIPQLWTGLLDKDGREIYEGDIVKREYLEGTIIAPITYGEEYPAFVHGDNLLWTVWPWETSVLGNIFENSDLLK